jgi:uncharacterized protein YlzI (FlbEa/FlbD family)
MKFLSLNHANTFFCINPSQIVAIREVNDDRKGSLIMMTGGKDFFVRDFVGDILDQLKELESDDLSCADIPSEP